jgi:hypothetical protein
MPKSCQLVACAIAALALLLLASVGPAGAETRKATGWRLFSECENNCAVSILAGPLVEDSMADVLYKAPELPFSWDYRSDDWLVGFAVSRYAGTLFGRIDFEPEIGLAQRFGRQDETEIWAALYIRYRGFPWDDFVTTSAALSTGVSYASDISDVEMDRAGDEKGDRLLHYFSPEITLALPSNPDLELIFRFHHRSGVFGLVSEARGGAQYGTVGLRYRF